MENKIMKLSKAKEIVLALRKAGIDCNNCSKIIGTTVYPGESMVVIQRADDLT